MAKIIQEKNIKIDDENYFDIAEAIHTVLTLWHDGKHGYVLLCRSKFKPGMAWNENKVISENEYYNEVNSLVENKSGEFLGYSEIEKLQNRLEYFLENIDD